MTGVCSEQKESGVISTATDVPPAGQTREAWASFGKSQVSRLYFPHLKHMSLDNVAPRHDPL